MHPFHTFCESDKSKATSNLQSKIDLAIAIIQSKPASELYIGHSGGKDSVAITWLTSKAYTSIPIVHSVKSTGDNAVHPKTIEFLYNLASVEPILFVPRNFNLSENYKIQIDGTRISEHNRTNGRSTTVVIDGQEVDRKNLTSFVEKGLFGKSYLYPIYDWDDIDVWALISMYNIPFSHEYLEEFL